MTKKEMKVELAPGALDEVPEDEREEVMQEVADLFKNFDPSDPPGTRVLPIEPGTTDCPKCGSKLEDPFPVNMPGGKVLFYDCEACDNVFAHETQ